VYPGASVSTSFQAAAATATTRMVGSGALSTAFDPSVVIGALVFSSAKIPAVGESMVIDVRRINPDGTSVSILSAPFTYDHTAVALGILLPLKAPIEQQSLAAASGSGYEVVRTYTNGGSGVMTATQVLAYTNL
jgi:hypothetical protein